MDWLNISAEAALRGLFASSFLAATVLPGGSEALLFALLKLHPAELWSALTLATIGNTLGGMTSYAGGRWLPATKKSTDGTAQEQVRQRQLQQLQRWGSPILLLAWAPLIGDALCVGAGWLRLDWRACALFMAIGKLGRYWLVAQGALW